MAESTDLKVLEAEYRRRVTAYQRLADEVAFILNKDALSQRGAVIHGLTYRIKTFDSLQRKVESGKFREPLNKIDDLVGFRIVCLLRSHINLIVAFARDHFNVVKERDRNESDDVSSFGYQAHTVSSRLKIVTRGHAMTASLNRDARFRSAHSRWTLGIRLHIT